MKRAYLLIGGNMGNREGNLAAAREAIEAHCGRIGQQSGVYETAAWGEQDQPSFLNQALALETALGPEELMARILEIEASLGRTRERKYGPRIIDIDIILYADEVIKKEGLTVPHPRMQERRFVLACMDDIAPAVIHPVLQKTVRQLLAECPDPLTVNKIN
jgi:2-amino-4-hydroxy-6-hydroxymethyldihydropteridine diphosphokinase